MSRLSNDELRAELSRRAFLRYGAALGALGLAAPSLLMSGARATTAPDGEVLTGSHWGAFRAKVEGGRMVSITPWRRTRRQAINWRACSIPSIRRPASNIRWCAGLSREGTGRRSRRPRDRRFRARFVGPGHRPRRQGTEAGRKDLWPGGDLRRLLRLEKSRPAAQLPEPAEANDEPEGQLRELVGRLFDRGRADHHAARRRHARNLRTTDRLAGCGRQDRVDGVLGRRPGRRPTKSAGRSAITAAIEG